MTNNTTTPRPLNASERVLAEADDLDFEDRRAAWMEHGFILNTEPGWRPSDAMRQAVSRVRNGTVRGVAARKTLGLF